MAREPRLRSGQSHYIARFPIPAAEPGAGGEVCRRPGAHARPGPSWWLCGHPHARCDCPHILILYSPERPICSRTTRMTTARPISSRRVRSIRPQGTVAGVPERRIGAICDEATRCGHHSPMRQTAMIGNGQYMCSDVRPQRPAQPPGQRPRSGARRRCGPSGDEIASDQGAPGVGGKDAVNRMVTPSTLS